MNIEKLLRWLITAGIVIAMLVIGAVAGIVSMIGLPIPVLVFLLPILLCGIALPAIWNEQIWGVIRDEILVNISAEIAKEMRKLKPEELEEARKGMEEFRQAFGIEIPLPKEKRKRDQIDAAIRKLSDSQLLDLKEGINDGSIGEDDLLDWLSEQEETMVD